MKLATLLLGKVYTGGVDRLALFEDGNVLPTDVPFPTFVVGVGRMENKTLHTIIGVQRLWAKLSAVNAQTAFDLLSLCFQLLWVPNLVSVTVPFWPSWVEIEVVRRREAGGNGSDILFQVLAVSGLKVETEKENSGGMHSKQTVDVTILPLFPICNPHFPPILFPLSKSRVPWEKIEKFTFT